MANLLSKNLIRGWLRKRPRGSHKGDFGHVLVVAGSRGMVGAGVLSAAGALRGGAGLVTLAVPRSQQAAAAKNVRPEAMTLGLPENRRGSFSSRAAGEILKYVRKRRISSLVLGPGMTRDPETARLVANLLPRIEKTGLQGLVLDADGFLALGRGRFSSARLRRLKVPAVVTPHPGELARFCGVSIARIQADRILSAKKFAKLNGVVCVLKGHRTIVADKTRAFVNPTGNPGMATGGSGDVLSGLVAALIRNVVPGPDSGMSRRALRAAAAGVYIHGLAGDLAAGKKTEIGMIAGDIAEAIPEALKKIGIGR